MNSNPPPVKRPLLYSCHYLSTKKKNLEETDDALGPVISTGRETGSEGGRVTAMAAARCLARKGSRVAGGRGKGEATARAARAPPLIIMRVTASTNQAEEKIRNKKISAMEGAGHPGLKCEFRVPEKKSQD